MRKADDSLFYVLDISLREKFAGLAYAASAGVLADAVARQAATLGLRAASGLVTFPEFTAPVIGAVAFCHAANAASETWSRRVPPAALRLREKRAPRISF